jgi:hypothetical protein
MGPLEDAIREHLELMRRRGADPADIARAESEALTPATREVEAPQAHDDNDDLIAGTEPVPAPDPVEVDDDSDVIVPFEDDPHVAAAEVEPLDQEPSTVDQPTAHFDTLGSRDLEAEVAEEDGDWDNEALRSQDAAVEANEEIFEDEDEDGEGADDACPVAGPSEDVLEDTPDFLAETPDHDKLWFEQSGPRDFDFDDEKK